MICIGGVQWNFGTAEPAGSFATVGIVPGLSWWLAAARKFLVSYIPDGLANCVTVQENHSPLRAAVEAASVALHFCANQLGLIVSYVQGGLVQLAVKSHLVWLQSDGFKVRTCSNKLNCLSHHCGSAAFSAAACWQPASIWAVNQLPSLHAGACLLHRDLGDCHCITSSLL